MCCPIGAQETAVTGAQGYAQHLKVTQRLQVSLQIFLQISLQISLQVSLQVSLQNPQEAYKGAVGVQVCEV